MGNYPQAFTHLSLIAACYNIDQMLNRSGESHNWLYPEWTAVYPGSI